MNMRIWLEMYWGDTKCVGMIWGFMGTILIMYVMTAFLKIILTNIGNSFIVLKGKLTSEGSEKL